ncbi:DUF547 domain-containing protein [Aliiglaciecola lipolytica]|uniref:DUF547 domain-containing protein n=1 Tax=Aliiglaciecola lipolytica E3 TaxID=1127673 RepID=K6X7H0_9ALTE|nr:DUF547 domain-containing protein [Aliiglaciecola lipolytica]GAC16569.1 hypothetical protein GLIP_3958 [Aliiglaciecola lipolytica E3]
MLKYMTKTLLLVTFALSIPVVSSASDLHNKWHEIVSQHVVTIDNGHSTAVDYAAIKQHHGELRAYLNSLEAVTQDGFKQWNKEQQLAFLINAYNAWTVELILTEYPDLQSIKDLGGLFSSPWSKKFIPLLGKTRSLDDIEHNLIRGSDKYNDPRIHFAVNCASIGCPALLEEAYTGEKLDEQLHAQTVRFLSDKTRNFAQDNTLNLSSIFKWYGDDFSQGFNGAMSLQQFLLQYSTALALTDKQRIALKNDAMTINFLDYNWELNAHQ